MRENISDLVETLEPRASFKKNNNGKKGSKRKPTQPGVEIFQNLKDSNTEQSAKMIANPLGEDLCGLDIPRRIIGGTTTDIDEFPWLCLLQYLNSKIENY